MSLYRNHFADTCVDFISVETVSNPASALP